MSLSGGDTNKTYMSVLSAGTRRTVPLIEVIITKIKYMIVLAIGTMMEKGPVNGGAPK